MSLPFRAPSKYCRRVYAVDEELQKYLDQRETSENSIKRFGRVRMTGVLVSKQT